MHEAQILIKLTRLISLNLLDELTNSSFISIIPYFEGTILNYIKLRMDNWFLTKKETPPEMILQDLLSNVVPHWQVSRIESMLPMLNRGDSPWAFLRATSIIFSRDVDRRQAISSST